MYGTLHSTGLDRFMYMWSHSLHTVCNLLVFLKGKEFSVLAFKLVMFQFYPR